MNASDYRDRVKRLKEVNSVVKTLEPAIREGAFELLKGYITSGAPEKRAKDGPKKSHTNDSTDGKDFIATFDHEKPSDNAKLIAAYYYREYGSAAFSLDEVRETAEDVGVTIPARLDMTLQGAVKDGKKLFRRAGRGKFKPTVHGEKYMKDTYKVSKGTKKKADESDK